MILAVVLSMSRQDSLPPVAEVVSKMIARYNAAKSIKGEVTSTINVGDQTIVIKSTIQLERPAKLYLRQEVVGQNQQFVVTSDGKEFSYQKPIDTPRTDRYPTTRLVEDVLPTTGLGDIYRAVAQSLAERSAGLDFLISDVRDLRSLRDQWSTMTLTGLEQLNGEDVYRIVGKWRLNKADVVTANYGMFVTPAGDLRKYVIDQIPGSVKIEEGDMDVRITRTIEMKADLDATLDVNLFKVLR